MNKFVKKNKRFLFIYFSTALVLFSFFYSALNKLGNYNNRYDKEGRVAGTAAKTVNPTVNTAYLTNPGIGWQHAPGIGTALLEETVSYPNRSDIGWKLIHTGENTFNWNLLDSKINEAKAAGKQIGFRIYSMRGEDYGGHYVPQWALDKGVKLKSGAPDYANCEYQQYWSTFVEALRQKYDGNPDIAFIDISGYGNFNEWSWQDGVTEWDDTWASAYSKGTASSSTMSTLDAKTRRRLTDIFIGGSFTGHDCRNSSGQNVKVNYTYTGFQKTQLIMPYAGIRQATQYTYLKRKDVGFRHDCLARTTSADMKEKVGNEVSGLWKQSPIIYEFCAYDVNLSRSTPLLESTHASLVHDNLEGSNRQKTTIENMMKYVGYRYVLKTATYDSQTNPGGTIYLSMAWQNVGYAPNYPKMGQKFNLKAYIVNSSNQVVATLPVSADITKWLPADPIPGTAPTNMVNQSINVPSNIANGTYTLKIGILDERTNKNIKLAINGGDSANMYTLGDLTISGSSTDPICGNKVREGTEVCDGGQRSCNVSGYEGLQTCKTDCSGYNECTASQRCGDGQLQGPEICDDGNTANNDQCSNDCKNKCTSPKVWNGSACVDKVVQVCGNGTIETGEVCDDGNTANNDQCSSDCKNKCTSPKYWNGTACVEKSLGCKADYNKNGTVDSNDLQTFASNYKKTGIDCTLDLANNDCLLNLVDFIEMASVYQVTGACNL